MDRTKTKMNATICAGGIAICSSVAILECNAATGLPPWAEAYTSYLSKKNYDEQKTYHRATLVATSCLFANLKLFMRHDKVTSVEQLLKVTGKTKSQFAELSSNVCYHLEGPRQFSDNMAVWRDVKIRYMDGMSLFLVDTLMTKKFNLGSLLSDSSASP